MRGRPSGRAAGRRAGAARVAPSRGTPGPRAGSWPSWVTDRPPRQAGRSQSRPTPPGDATPIRTPGRQRAVTAGRRPTTPARRSIADPANPAEWDRPGWRVPAPGAPGPRDAGRPPRVGGRSLGRATPAGGAGPVGTPGQRRAVVFLAVVLR